MDAMTPTPTAPRAQRVEVRIVGQVIDGNGRVDLAVIKEASCLARACYDALTTLRLELQRPRPARLPGADLLFSATLEVREWTS